MCIRLALFIADVSGTFKVVHDTEGQVLVMEDAFWIVNGRHKGGIWPRCPCLGYFQELLEKTLYGDVNEIANAFCFWERNGRRVIALLSFFGTAFLGRETSEGQCNDGSLFTWYVPMIVGVGAFLLKCPPEVACGGSSVHKTIPVGLSHVCSSAVR